MVALLQNAVRVNPSLVAHLTSFFISSLSKDGLTRVLLAAIGYNLTQQYATPLERTNIIINIVALNNLLTHEKHNLNGI